MQKSKKNASDITIILILIILTTCVSGTESTCGNDDLEGLEVCDGDYLSSKTCLDFGYEYGELSCCPDCKNFDLSGCYNINTGPCFDGDNGKNYYIASNASQSVVFKHGEFSCSNITEMEDIGPCDEGGYLVVEDICEINTLREAICNETTGIPQLIDYDCEAEGKECMNGVCVAVEVCENCNPEEQCVVGRCVASQPANSLFQKIISWIFNLN